MIRFSVTIMRGCFGGCTFCSITEHEGRIIQNRSEASILREIEQIRDRTPGFTGVISDIGGPTAFAIRKPAVAIFTLDDYAEAGIMSRLQAAVLRKGVADRRSEEHTYELQSLMRIS